MSGFWVLPVEVRLLWAEEMEVVFLSVFIPLPHAACKVGDPVVRLFALAVDIAGWPPDVPVALWVIFGGPGFQKPLVLCVVNLRCFMEQTCSEDIPDQRYG